MSAASQGNHGTGSGSGGWTAARGEHERGVVVDADDRARLYRLIAVHEAPGKEFMPERSSAYHYRGEFSRGRGDQVIYRVVGESSYWVWSKESGAMEISGPGPLMGAFNAQLADEAWGDLPMPLLSNPRVRFWFTERGWRAYFLPARGGGRRRGGRRSGRRQGSGAWRRLLLGCGRPGRGRSPGRRRDR